MFILDKKPPEWTSEASIRPFLRIKYLLAFGIFLWAVIFTHIVP